jgi:hypothetical protein
MKRTKLYLGLGLAALGLGSSAFTTRHHAKTNTSYFWYTLANVHTVAGATQPSTSVTEANRLDAANPGFTYGTAISSTTKVERGWTMQNPTTKVPSGSKVTMLRTAIVP